MADEGAVRSLREELDAAYDASMEKENPDAPAPDAPPPDAPVPDTSTPTPDAPAPDTGTDGGPARGADGKFVSKSGTPAPAAAPGAAPGAASGAAPAQPLAAAAAPAMGVAPAAPLAAPDGPRAPSSWRPALREKWSGVDAEVKAEISRRESEIQRAMQESSDAREMAMRFIETVRPYEAFIRAENSDPFQAIQYMMDTAVALRTSPPAQKAMMVAGLVKQYGIDVALLDQALVGGGQLPGNAQTMAVQDMVQKQLAPFKQFIDAQQQHVNHKQQALTQEANTTVEQFANNPANEFYSDVEDTMADLLEAAALRGRAMTLKESYDAACQVHPEVSKVVVGRRMKEQAAAEQARANTARAASRSLPGGAAPVSTGLPEGATLREVIEHSVESLSGR